MTTMRIEQRDDGGLDTTWTVDQVDIAEWISETGTDVRNPPADMLLLDWHQLSQSPCLAGGDVLLAHDAATGRAHLLFDEWVRDLRWDGEFADLVRVVIFDPDELTDWSSS